GLALALQLLVTSRPTGGFLDFPGGLFDRAVDAIFIHLASPSQKRGLGAVAEIDPGIDLSRSCSRSAWSRLLVIRGRLQLRRLCFEKQRRLLRHSPPSCRLGEIVPRPQSNHRISAIAGQALSDYGNLSDMQLVAGERANRP